jgi:hypothetical protein
MASMYPTFEETTARAIEACEAAWAFFGGVFAVLIPDNTKAIIVGADPLTPRITPAFLEVAFRYPKDAVDVRALRRYAAGHAVEIRSTGSNVIIAISVESDGESFDTADDGSSWLSSLSGLRADLASGDERVLYLGWLLGVQCCEIDDDGVEPARPDGLGRLSPTLDSFIDIMGIDRDLIAAAAEGASRARAIAI